MKLLPVFLSILAVVASSVAPGCVATDSAQLRYDATRFNERIRADLHPLTVDDLATDLDYGFFLDGQGGGLVSELYPYSPLGGSNGQPPSLVQTPCLFVGSRHDQNGARILSDELRLSWELVGNVDRAVEPLDELFVEKFEEIGLCSYSSPVLRLFGEDPDAPLYPSDPLESCRADGEIALTLRTDFEENRNLRLYCLLGGNSDFVIALEAFPPREENPDAQCPAGPFDGSPTQVVEGAGFEPSGPIEGGLFAACRRPAAGVVPTSDASYRISLTANPRFSNTTPQRWLEPNVMVVDGRRSLARAMTRTGSDHAWQTRVEHRGSLEGPLRWHENFTPVVRVASVEIVSRDASGGDEQVETPAARELRITVPRPDGLAPDELRCLGKERDGRFSFLIRADGETSDCAVSDRPSLLVLTPTYAVSHVFSDPAVETPITWSVELPGLPADRQAFIRFGLEVSSAPPPTMRITAMRDFGRLQVGAFAQNELALENVGGGPLEVRSIDFDKSVLGDHPGDFSFLVAGDPVPLPLPIEAKPDTGGGASLRWAADAEDAPILTFTDHGTEVDVSLGDPARGSGSETLTVYGQDVHLVGNLILRADPAATFVPAAGGDPRPFALETLAERTLPFVLEAGEEVRILVTTTPSATGDREAGIRAEAVDLITGLPLYDVVGRLVVEGLQGPIASLVPGHLTLGFPPERPSASRKALLHSVGQVDLDVTRIFLRGAGAARFTVAAHRGATPFTLPPADYSDLTITYSAECDGTYGTATSWVDHEAELVVESSDRTLSMPVYGVSYYLCGAP